jgi:hypothetical protein
MIDKIISDILSLPVSLQKEAIGFIEQEHDRYKAALENGTEFKFFILDETKELAMQAYERARMSDPSL